MPVSIKFRGITIPGLLIDFWNEKVGVDLLHKPAAQIHEPLPFRARKQRVFSDLCGLPPSAPNPAFTI
jgi:hypothetical protein